MEEYMWIVWLVFFVITLILEAMSSALISVWFAVGALVALGCSFIPGLPFWGEILIFLGVSGIAFLLIRPFLRRFMKKGTVTTNVDSLIGAKGVMKVGCDSLNEGEVALRGAVWTAIPAKEGESFQAGQVVRIVRIDGNKLLVEEAKK